MYSRLASRFASHPGVSISLPQCFVPVALNAQDRLFNECHLHRQTLIRVLFFCWRATNITRSTCLYSNNFANFARSRCSRAHESSICKLIFVFPANKCSRTRFAHLCLSRKPACLKRNKTGLVQESRSSKHSRCVHLELIGQSADRRSL